MYVCLRECVGWPINLCICMFVFAHARVCSFLFRDYIANDYISAASSLLRSLTPPLASSSALFVLGDIVSKIADVISLHKTVISNAS